MSACYGWNNYFFTIRWGHPASKSKRSCATSKQKPVPTLA